MRAAVCAGVFIWAATEAFSLFSVLNRTALLIVWSIAILAILPRVLRLRPRHFAPSRLDWFVALSVVACAAILVLTALAAAFSPPNSADAMAYHMPRVLYWAEQHSVRFFPTSYLNQIMLQPFAEYAMLHTYLLSNGDHFINFIQWTASALSIIAVSLIAREFDAPPRAQAAAALFCAAIPSGILAASGAKNDYVLAFWLAAAVYFALRWRHSRGRSDALLLGCALGLALLTKATAYLFAPWPLAVILASAFTRNFRQSARILACIAGCALLINLPQYLRNLDLSGSPLGFGSSFANADFRWRNEPLGLKQTASNILRNGSEQLGARSDSWNHAVYNAVLAAHHALGIDPNDPGTTWRWSAYGPPRNANHEADAPNRTHLAICAALFCLLLYRAARGRDRLLVLYALSLICGFVAFCFYLKWQPFMARLFLPLFVLAAPLASLVRPVWLQLALLILLLDGARHPALDNWVRPLRGPQSVFSVARDSQYFSDMVQWREDWPAYWAATAELAKSSCETIAIDISHFQLEYPLQALLRESNPRVQFVHAGVTNPSAKYPPPIASPPCAVVCLHCEGGDRRAGSFAITYHR